MDCEREGCTNTARYEVVLELRARKGHEPAVSKAIVVVCETHKNVTWHSVVTKEVWNWVCQGFDRFGFARPKKTFSNVRVQELDQV